MSTKYIPFVILIFIYKLAFILFLMTPGANSVYDIYGSAMHSVICSMVHEGQKSVTVLGLDRCRFPG